MKPPANDNKDLNDFLGNGLECCRGVFNALAGIVIFWVIVGIATYIVLRRI